MAKIKPSKKTIYATPIGIIGLMRHQGQALLLGLKKMLAAPFASVLTFLVVAFAIALPLLMWTLLINTQMVFKDWQSTQITVYLKKETSATQSQQLLQELQHNPLLKRAEFIPAAQGLQEFEKHTGLTNILAALQHNPLPDVIEIFPSRALQESPKKVQMLLTELRSLPQVELVQLDMEWVKKMHALTLFIEQLVLILAAILAVGVILIIINTIRFISHSARDEIRVIKLVGGSKAYICRPYLYMGLIYGLGGGTLAIVAVCFGISQFSQAIRQIALLFNGQLTLQTFDGLFIGEILAASALLGYLGAWLSIRWQLWTTEIH